MPARQPQNFDIVIAGGGLTGGALALALRDSGLNIVLLDARADDAVRNDARVLALGEAARQALMQIGVWPRLEAISNSGVPAAQPVDEVRICQQKGAGLMRLTASDIDAETLGHMVSMPALQNAVDATLRKALKEAPATDGKLTRHFNARLQTAQADENGVTVRLSSLETPITTPLLVIADGNGALLPATKEDEAPRGHYDYGQCAVLARLQCDASIRELRKTPIAYEYFTEAGPLALLPYRDDAETSATYRLVWTVNRQRAEAINALSEAVFTAELNRVLGRICTETGRVLRATARQTVPLQLDYAKIVTGPRSVVLGNAAQRLHPVGAQGFNLGLRDVMALQRTIKTFSYDATALGSPLFLSHYAKQREADRTWTLSFTHAMAQVLGHDTLLTRAPRGLALSVLDLLTPLRRRAARALIFGHSAS